MYLKLLIISFKVLRKGISFQKIINNSSKVQEWWFTLFVEFLERTAKILLQSDYNYWYDSLRLESKSKYTCEYKGAFSSKRDNLSKVNNYITVILMIIADGLNS